MSYSRWGGSRWYGFRADRDADKAANIELETEVDRLCAALAKLYDAIGSTAYTCPLCGGVWRVPDALIGDPRFGCPHCEVLQ